MAAHVPPHQHRNQASFYQTPPGGCLVPAAYRGGGGFIFGGGKIKPSGGVLHSGRSFIFGRYVIFMWFFKQTGKLPKREKKMTANVLFFFWMWDIYQGPSITTVFQCGCSSYTQNMWHSVKDCESVALREKVWHSVKDCAFFFLAEEKLRCGGLGTLCTIKNSGSGRTKVVEWLFAIMSL